MEIEITEKKVEISVFKAVCKFCERIMERPYPEQLRYNMKTHQNNCPKNPDRIKRNKQKNGKSKSKTD